MSNQGEKGSMVLQWIGWADNDYIAARLLLLNDELAQESALIQGSSLSNTAIEKYLKALFIHLDLKIPKGFKGHNVSNLYSEIKKKGITLDISEEYLAMLFKSYRLRYPDLNIGDNFILCKTKLLVELDRTVYEIRSGFNFERKGEKIKTRIEELKEKNNPILLDKNCYFGNYNRAALFQEKNPCYELRIEKNGVPIEAFIYRSRINDDGKFDGEALKPNGKGTYQMGEWPK
jgi:HEPN domain-containing protein